MCVKPMDKISRLSTLPFLGTKSFLAFTRKAGKLIINYFLFVDERIFKFAGSVIAVDDHVLALEVVRLRGSGEIMLTGRMLK